MVVCLGSQAYASNSTVDERCGVLHSYLARQTFSPVIYTAMNRLTPAGDISSR